MSGSGAQKRSSAAAVRAARLRREGFTLGGIAAAMGITKIAVREKIKIGERILSLEVQQ